MKELFSKEFDLGSDAKGKAYVGVDAESVKVAVEAAYPVAILIEKVTKPVDKALDKLEALIPGDWDKALIEKLKEEYKEELLKLLTE